MLYSRSLAKTRKTIPHDADSVNARLLIQGGFINQLAAGIYSYLPLGLRVLRKVQKIIRQEMEAIGGQEILMPALIPKQSWETTGRWNGFDVLFKLQGAGERDYALGPTHEEVVTPLVREYVKSYKDLPVMVYQIQDKFRDEPRAKSGLLRGREFSMKDLYSFHLTAEELDNYYDQVMATYLRIFQNCGLDAVVTEASGGTFSPRSHEFQVATPNGEDTIFICEKCRWAQNREIAKVKAGDVCEACSTGRILEVKAIEVGNIFKLDARFSEPFVFKVTGPDGQKQPVLMGCYGIGPSRVVGSIVEVHHDEQGILWPKSVTPYDVHLISLNAKDAAISARVLDTAESLYRDLEVSGIEVLWDDRPEASAGEKFADADLIGVPLRLIVSEKTLAADSVEWKERHRADAHFIPLSEIIERTLQFVQEASLQ